MCVYSPMQAGKDVGGPGTGTATNQRDEAALILSHVKEGEGARLQVEWERGSVGACWEQDRISGDEKY